MEGALSVIALVVVVMSAGTIAVAAHFRKERTAVLRAWTHDRGWTYTEYATRPLEDATLPQSTSGPHPRAQHVLTGFRGQHMIVAFEQTHTEGRGTGRVRHAHRIVAVRAPGPSAELQIVHRRDREARDDTFDNAFHTVSGDPAFTEAVLDGVVTRWLLADPRSRSLPVRFSGNYVLTWATMRLDPDRALTAADFLISLVDRVPAEAWKRRAPGP